MAWRHFAIILVAGFTSALVACSNDTEGGGTGATGSSCGDATCGSDEVCVRDYSWCGPPPSGDDLAHCHPRNAECDQSLPVCGCDKKVYQSQCDAFAAGVDIGGAEAGQELCPHDQVPAGRFACGPWFCDAAMSYCYYGDGDTGDRKMECRALPAECGGTASCDCVPQPGSSTCSTIEGNGVSGVVVNEALL